MIEKWLILDGMGVIFERKYGIEDLLVPFVKIKNPTVLKQSLLKSYYKASLGLFPSSIFWQKIGLADQYPKIENEFLESYLMLNSNFVTYAEKWIKRFNLVLLSNNVKEWIDYACKKFDIAKFFKYQVISSEVGIRKPDIRIYLLFLKKAGAVPENCIFIDDKYKNLIMASKLGINSVLFSQKKTIEKSSWQPEVKNFKELDDLLKIFE